MDARRFAAVIFDLDGVITDTARVHAAAWKRLFDQELALRGPGEPARPFDMDDYRRYVDGRSPRDGVEAFLASRGIHLPSGRPDDSAGTPTAWGLANRKNALFLDALATEGLHVFQSSVEFVQQVRAAELATGVVTASRNRAQVLATAGIQALFDVHVDGLDAASLNLPGKPDPATFLEAAHRLDLAPRRAVVVEDALAGVEAGRRGGFGLVVGVDRANLRAALLAAGANLVVSNLSELRVPGRRGRR